MTDRSQHTPGPWIYHSGMVFKDGPNVYPKGKDDGIPIARMDREPGNGTDPCERDANAKLCAAAPELLTCCQSVLLRLDAEAKVLGGRNPVFVCGGMRDSLRIAIAKAQPIT